MSGNVGLVVNKVAPWWVSFKSFSLHHQFSLLQLLHIHWSSHNQHYTVSTLTALLSNLHNDMWQHYIQRTVQSSNGNSSSPPSGYFYSESQYSCSTSYISLKFIICIADVKLGSSWCSWLTAIGKKKHTKNMQLFPLSAYSARIATLCNSFIQLTAT
jgi:hypothetical protein